MIADLKICPKPSVVQFKIRYGQGVENKNIDKDIDEGFQDWTSVGKYIRSESMISVRLLTNEENLKEEKKLNC